MKASLDTNVMIHLYRANQERILFDFFKDGVFIYEQIKNIELAYNHGDMGEVYAISLAQTIGAYSLVTDDTKQGGPYMSLLQFVDYDVMPLTFADIIILQFLAGEESATDAIDIFEMINEASNLKWSFRTQLGKFIRRFWRDPYQKIEKEWMSQYCKEKGVSPKDKLKELQGKISKQTKI